MRVVMYNLLLLLWLLLCSRTETDSRVEQSQFRFSVLAEGATQIITFDGKWYETKNKIQLYAADEVVMRFAPRKLNTQDDSIGATWRCND